MKFAKKLRQGKIKRSDIKAQHIPDLVLLLDNVYDTYNVGGMYRVGDASGVSRIYHAGQTPIGPNPKISRAAVGLDQYLAHEKAEDSVSQVQILKKAGYQIVVLEQTPNSQVYDQVKYHGKIALIVGNETFGVSQPVLALADIIVELPMFGINKSLNVVVATGIVLYQIRRTLGFAKFV